MKIAHRLIGVGAPCFVIAELGINHNGSVPNAKMLVSAAKAAGADMVKFQKRHVSVVFSPEELTKPRLIPRENGILENAVRRGVLSPEAVDRLEKSNYEKTTNGDLKWALEFTLDEYQEIADFCREQDMLFCASPWDEISVDFMEQLAVPCHKIASASLTDTGLLEKVRATGKPVLLSTGMSTHDEIIEAVSVIGAGNDLLALLHSVSTYPTQDTDLNLRMIQTLAKQYPQVPVGYSGHEKGILPSIVAVAMGASIVERHLTLDRRMWGSDQPASLEPGEFTEMVTGIRTIESALGDGVKRVLSGEVPIREKLRRKHFWT